MNLYSRKNRRNILEQSFGDKPAIIKMKMLLYFQKKIYSIIKISSLSFFIK
jgi:hypothetical protein